MVFVAQRSTRLLIIMKSHGQFLLYLKGNERHTELAQLSEEVSLLGSGNSGTLMEKYLLLQLPGSLTRTLLPLEKSREVAGFQKGLG